VGGDVALPPAGKVVAEVVAPGVELAAVADPVDVPVGGAGSGAFAPLEVSGGGSGGGLLVCAKLARGTATAARASNARMKLE
jgi:hypothetical protein